MTIAEIVAWTLAVLAAGAVIAEWVSMLKGGKEAVDMEHLKIEHEPYTTIPNAGERLRGGIDPAMLGARTIDLPNAGERLRTDMTSEHDALLDKEMEEFLVLRRERVRENIGKECDCGGHKNDGA